MRLYMAAARWLLIFFVPLTALAVGLGEIRLDSALNQPFSAEIPLESANASELLEMEVALASRETFDRYGLDRPAFLSDFRFAVDNDANGNPIVRVSSLKPVSEPFVTFLLDIRWGSGRLLREYTVLLDPPLFENEVVQPAIAAAETGTVSESQATGQIERQAAESEYQDSTVIEPTGLFQADKAIEPAEPQRNVAGTQVSEPPAQPLTEPQPRSAAPVAIAPPSGTYKTQRGDTLWRIAERMRGNTGLTNNQMMLALYRANPDAFMGNINALKAGAILRMPAEQGVSAPGITEANNEVKQQNSAWRGAAPAGAAGQARLQLVAPGSVDEPQGSGAAPAGDSTAGQGDAAQLQERVGQLEAELNESKRLLQLRDAELQALQERINSLEQEAAEAGDIPEDGAEVTEPEQIFVDETSESEPVDATDDGAEVPPQAAEQPASESVADEEGLFGGIWLWAGAAIALLLVAFLAWRRRQAAAETADSAGWVDDMSAETAAVTADASLKDFSDLEPAEEPFIVAEDEDSITDADATYDDRQLSDFAAADSDEDALAGFSSDDVSEFDDEEDFAGLSEQDDAVSFDAAEAGAGEAELPLEKTISTGAPLNLDQADPIAEAEFHMAYGLYDQAAELLANALDDEPDNRAYRVKLLEVYFVWENKEGFLEQARALHESIGDSADSDWSKVLILGKQLCPDDALFSGASAGGPISGSVDLELSEAGEGETELDFEFGDDGSEGPDLDLNLPESSGVDEDPLDFELGKDDGATMESPTVDIDFADFGDDSEGATMESPTIESPFGLSADEAEGETMESPTIESPFGLGSDETEGETMESPTIESPFNMDDDESSDGASAMDSTVESPAFDDTETAGDSSEGRAESPQDDLTSLDVDLSGLTDLPVDELEGVSEVDEIAGDSEDDIFGSLSESIPSESADGVLSGADPTVFGGDEDRSSSETDNEEDEMGFASLEALGEIAGDEDGGLSQPGDDDSSWLTSEDSEIAEQASAEVGDTLQQPSAEQQGSSDTAVQPPVDSGPGDTSVQPVISEADEMDLDLELGALSEDALPEEATLAADDGLLLPDDATMTEVGTKLDLARAYIDMGDPDGARSILEEVLDEGGESQQQEARQLLDELSD
ncbi:MAG: FimV/HubP family polar landmark protein [Gammaproteobacteria bacterium]